MNAKPGKEFNMIIFPPEEMTLPMGKPLIVFLFC